VVSLWRLTRNENMKIMERTRTVIMMGLLILMLFVMAFAMRWMVNVAGSTLDMWEFAVKCTHLLFGVQLFAVVIAGDIVSGEFAWGTVKLLLIRPVGRTKILLSKYMAVLWWIFVCMAVLLIGSLLFGMVFFRLTLDPERIITVWKHLGTVYVLYAVEVIMTATLAFMLSAVSRSSTLSVGLSIFLLFSGSVLAEIMKLWGWSWGKYLLFANLDLTSYVVDTGTHFPGISLGFSLTVLAAYFLLFHLIAWLVFTKKDVSV